MCRLITIYDCRVVLDWSGTASDGTAVSGKLTIPEVSHENTLDGTSDYVVRAYICLATQWRRSVLADAFFALCSTNGA